ncbi:gastrula zinc finger protein XlCGF26.1 isoform X2 [Bactrocera dorsalis]|uniref:Gastrula zinc finger protein XlCGF26.1 isoform X2 n=1 Tax=Bactrocera dorsalis TaxID=27457 RepID=A0A6I9W4K6_BACDO|nr:gastrula zinc finger protein XlCGF26.1 isoform X2 [Bactrocera dorsalis]
MQTDITQCGLCLYQDKIVIPLRDDVSKTTADILATVHKFMGLLLTSNDAICVNCWTSVDNFREFCLLIAERQAAEAQQDTALKCSIEKHATENCSANDSVMHKATQNTNVPLNRKDESLKTNENIKTSPKGRLKVQSEEETQLEQQPAIVEVRNGAITLATLALEEQANNVKNRQHSHLQLNKTDLQDTTLQQNQTDTNTEADRDTNTLSDTESVITTSSAQKNGSPRLGDAESQAAEDKLIAEHLQLKCEVCEFEAKCFKALKAHYKRLHNSNGYVVCCEKRFYKRCMLLDHINVHRNPTYFSCTDCNMNFADRMCLRNHMLLKHPQATELPHACAICGARFAKVRFLKKHARRHMNNAAQDAEQQQCAICAKSFANAVRLQEHMKRTHGKSKLFVCKHCGHEVSGKQRYVRHLAQHGAQFESTSAKRRGQGVQCTECDKWLVNKSTLRLHMIRHTDPTSVYACPLCDTKEATRVALNEHKRLCHGIEQQPHVCQVCARNFSTTRRLREHMATHTGEDIYTCNYCDKRFKFSSNLYTHRKWKHPTEWAQDQSGKELESHVCQEHMTTHTGEDLYTCNYCDKRFKNNSSLYTHRKRKHPTEWAQDTSGKELGDKH